METENHEAGGLAATQRHAFLLMVHKDAAQVASMLAALDHERNDFFVHIDKGSVEFDVSRLVDLELFGNLTILPRKHVRWGTYSVVDCTMRLLEAATKRPHRYYHLLSGQDMPLRCSHEILGHFDSSTYEYVHFCSASEAARVRWRHQQFHLIARRKGPYKQDVTAALVNVSGKAVCGLQRLLGVRRKSGFARTAYGSQWFSVTDSLARDVLLAETSIRRRFRLTFVPDEHFIQTFILSRRETSIHSLAPETIASLRAIDWERGAPWVWRTSDVQSLVRGQAFFARKFDSDVDGQALTDLAAALTTRCAAHSDGGLQ